MLNPNLSRKSMSRSARRIKSYPDNKRVEESKVTEFIPEIDKQIELGIKVDLDKFAVRVLRMKPVPAQNKDTFGYKIPGKVYEVRYICDSNRGEVGIYLEPQPKIREKFADMWYFDVSTNVNMLKKKIKSFYDALIDYVDGIVESAKVSESTVQDHPKYADVVKVLNFSGYTNPVAIQNIPTQFRGGSANPVRALRMLEKIGFTMGQRGQRQVAYMAVYKGQPPLYVRFTQDGAANIESFQYESIQNESIDAYDMKDYMTEIGMRYGAPGPGAERLWSGNKGQITKFRNYLKQNGFSFVLLTVDNADGSADMYYHYSSRGSKVTVNVWPDGTVAILQGFGKYEACGKPHGKKKGKKKKKMSESPATDKDTKLAKDLAYAVGLTNIRKDKHGGYTYYGGKPDGVMKFADGLSSIGWVKEVGVMNKSITSPSGVTVDLGSSGVKVYGESNADGAETLDEIAAMLAITNAARKSAQKKKSTPAVKPRDIKRVPKKKGPGIVARAKNWIGGKKKSESSLSEGTWSLYDMLHNDPRLPGKMIEYGRRIEWEIYQALDIGMELLSKFKSKIPTATLNKVASVIKPFYGGEPPDYSTEVTDIAQEIFNQTRQYGIMESFIISMSAFLHILEDVNAHTWMQKIDTKLSRMPELQDHIGPKQSESSEAELRDQLREGVIAAKSLTEATNQKVQNVLYYVGDYWPDGCPVSSIENALDSYKKKVYASRDGMIDRGLITKKDDKYFMTKDGWKALDSVEPMLFADAKKVNATYRMYNRDIRGGKYDCEVMLYDSKGKKLAVARVSKTNAFSLPGQGISPAQMLALKRGITPVIKEASGVRMDAKTAKQINSMLRRSGFDGNGRYTTPAEGRSKISDVLKDFGYFLEAVMNHPMQMHHDNVEGTDSFTIYLDDAKGFKPSTEVSNRILFFSWYKMANGKFEILSYVS